MDKPSLTNRPDKPVTAKKYLANYCMDNMDHRMFKATDGARCVECNGLVNVKEVTKAEYHWLPAYTELHKRQNKKPSKSLSISVDMDTDKMQLKLRAIAKHVGALADELDEIDSFDECPKCSKLMSTSKLYSSDELKSVNSECECGYIMGCDFGNELPTQLEGSE
ncbi:MULTISPECIES: hypothetical protein [unclassified Lysinibacillus]|uniref:hypothetical protein n=1 Tax=unclassified Lysinibacillus TaxID=2636778 RepID=UPI000882327C|nr:MULTISPECIES: hypothetical protein [unclassified Lysinibacillus]SCY99096.1 hypothetical protein SAMN02787078_03448 [Lysinibacillus sp. SG9]SDB47068.1 hypothetical protein SAMN02787079_03615 [Lysinibacillus sp. TC-37]SFT12395.1 hypothetical protein SAMN02787087_03750 [Lysinibacillus sp. SG55]